MRPRWPTLNERERKAYFVTIEFLQGRLEERATIDWALQLKPDETAKRFAILDLIDGFQVEQKLHEPWLSGWRLIEESWSHHQIDEHLAMGAYIIKQRLSDGERSGALIMLIVKLVSPQLKVEPLSDRAVHYLKLPKRPKTVDTLFSLQVTSGETNDSDILDLLGSLNDSLFLSELATSLEAAVAKGLNLARRLWGGEEVQMWRLGQLHRVYFVLNAELKNSDYDPDRFHKGIAPSVKLLYAVVSRLVEIDISSAKGFISRWKVTNTPVYIRLWAAISRDYRITPVADVSVFLHSLSDLQFWDVQNYPEIAELRAKRFGEFDLQDQMAIITRIKNKPPNSLWPGLANDDNKAKARLYCAVQELHRIKSSGVSLLQHDEAWLAEMIPQFPNLLQSDRIDEGFLTSPKAQWVKPNPDSRYDLMTGEKRLKALEDALGAARGSWDNDPAERARNWIGLPVNITEVLSDFESVSEGGSAFNRVWDWFGWTHKPSESMTDSECGRVLSLISKLSEGATRLAIEGISQWLSTWAKQVVLLPQGLEVWLKLWPIAVEVAEAANRKQSIEDEQILNMAVRSSSQKKPQDLDTHNTPVGKLVGVFLSACPITPSRDNLFNGESMHRAMRDAIDQSPDTVLIVKYRLVLEMPYFMAADNEWAKNKLVAPLLDDSNEALILWRAVARQEFITSALMELLGKPMVQRATDLRLDRETRQYLVFKIVVTCLHYFKDKTTLLIPLASIQQLIRCLEDEMRLEAAKTVVEFVEDSPEQCFHSAAKFLDKVWPQERSLTTQGISRAFAKLPAISQEAFVEAMNIIERFLIPFDCWLMADYGLHSDDKLSTIDSPEKAEAFLRLLNLTIGTAERSIIPYDLSNALAQIREVNPKLEKNKKFRRLATAARRN